MLKASHSLIFNLVIFNNMHFILVLNKPKALAGGESECTSNINLVLVLVLEESWDLMSILVNPEVPL